MRKKVGGFIFISSRSDHRPYHVHVKRDSDYIIDCRVPDFDLWPAPMAMMPAHWLEPSKLFVVKMDDGSRYPLKLADLPDADDSGVAKWWLSDDHYFFEVEQHSGNQLEIPWDVVLYHCEPEYEYYKGRQEPRAESDRRKRIGQRLRSLRLERDLTQKELAKRAGMQRPNVSRTEAGAHASSLETLERLAEALGIPVAELIAR